jgi:quercetin dioxygenase-like cupin family protein
MHRSGVDKLSKEYLLYFGVHTYEAVRVGFNRDFESISTHSVSSRQIEPIKLEEIISNMASDQQGNTKTSIELNAENWLTARPGERFCIRVSAASTAGRYSATEIVSSPGDSTPLHVHTREDEYAFVLEGVAQIVYGNEVIRAEAGTSIFLKRGIPHGWGNPTEKPIRLLMIASPGGCEEALRIIARANGPIDYQALAGQFGITHVGPPILS